MFSTVLRRCVWHWLIVVDHSVCNMWWEWRLHKQEDNRKRPHPECSGRCIKAGTGKFSRAGTWWEHTFLPHCALSPGSAGHTAQMGFIESVFQSDSYSPSLLIHIIIDTQSNDGVHSREFLYIYSPFSTFRVDLRLKPRDRQNQVWDSVLCRFQTRSNIMFMIACFCTYTAVFQKNSLMSGGFRHKCPPFLTLENL